MTERDSRLVFWAGVGIILIVVMMAVMGVVDMDDTQQQLPIPTGQL